MEEWNEIFDTEVGWAAIYPPDEGEEISAEYPPEIRKAYGREGILLQPIPPGEELWPGGPRADRWTICLHVDWLSDFEPEINRALGRPLNTSLSDEEWARAYEFASRIERACDDELEARLQKREQK